MTERDDSQMEARRGMRRDELVAQVIMSAIWAAVALVGLRTSLEAVQALAGQTTEASFFLGLLSDQLTSQGVAWGVAAFWFTMWNMKRKLHRNDRDRLGNRASMLEKLIDPSRSSSNLTRTGDTNPEDLHR